MGWNPTCSPAMVFFSSDDDVSKNSRVSDHLCHTICTSSNGTDTPSK